MKAAELRAKSVGDLKGELVELMRAQFSLRMQVATQQLSKVDQIGKVRRDIARVRTVLTEKTLEKAAQA
ncbi:MAG: 50S ribosomal protein L29 [Methylophilaceae bacterium]